jgi:hypothetical protein
MRLFGTNAPSTSDQGDRPPPEDDLHGGFQDSTIGLVESAEGFTHEALVEGGEDELDCRGLQEFSRLPVLAAGERTEVA